MVISKSQLERKLESLLLKIRSNDSDFQDNFFKYLVLDRQYQTLTGQQYDFRISKKEEKKKYGI